MDKKLTRKIVYEDMKKELNRIKKVRESNKERDEVEEHREPLSLDVKHEVTVLLSWGGPSDGFKLTFSNDWELLSGVYFVANWGEYEEVELNEDELSGVFDFYLYGDVSSFKDAK